MNLQTNDWAAQVQCIYALSVLILCARGARMTCEGACELYCAEYAALYRRLK